MPRAATDKGRGKTAIRPIPKTTQIGILLSAGAKPAAVHGLTDLFDTANRFSSELGGENPAETQTSHWHGGDVRGAFLAVRASSRRYDWRARMQGDVILS
jgi:hypothetical protein